MIVEYRFGYNLPSDRLQRYVDFYIFSCRNGKHYGYQFQLNIFDKVKECDKNIRQIKKEMNAVKDRLMKSLHETYPQTIETNNGTDTISAIEERYKSYLCFPDYAYLSSSFDEMMQHLVNNENTPYWISTALT